MNDMEILKQLYYGNHLSDSELDRAKGLVRVLGISIDVRESK